MFTSMLLILWVSIMTVMLFQKSPDQERAITSASNSLQALESTLSDVFSLVDHYHHPHQYYHENNNGCQGPEQPQVPWHAIVFLFYALWFCVFIFGAALIFWLEHNFTRNDWRKHKTRRLEYIESLLQRKKLQCHSSIPKQCDSTKNKSMEEDSNDTANQKPNKTIISQSMSSSLEDDELMQKLQANGAASCPICLEDFLNGDTICLSAVCPHVFHVTCMKQWLLRHDACPCCRQQYLALKPSEETKLDPSYVLPLDVWSLTAEDLPHWFIMTSEL